MLIQTKAEKSDPYRVLVFVGSDEGAATIVRILHEHDLATLCCHTPADLSMEIEIGGATVIADEESLRSDRRDVIYQALNNQRFRDVPLIVLSNGNDEDEIMTRLRDVSKFLAWKSSNVSDELVALVKELVEAKKSAWCGQLSE